MFPEKPIDRVALVRRHNPFVRDFTPDAALTIGNGNFAFTADATGLQTFPEIYEKRFPLATTSHWAWHTNPRPAEIEGAEFRYAPYDAHGRTVGYATDATGQESLFHWLRENPHRFHLGRIGLEMTRQNGDPVTPNDLYEIRQVLDLWEGRLVGEFEVDNIPVFVQTFCHPDRDLLAVRVESPRLLDDCGLKILIAFPFASPQMTMADWTARIGTKPRWSGKEKTSHS